MPIDAVTISGIAALYGGFKAGSDLWAQRLVVPRRRARYEAWELQKDVEVEDPDLAEELREFPEAAGVGGEEPPPPAGAEGRGTVHALQDHYTSSGKRDYVKGEEGTFVTERGGKVLVITWRAGTPTERVTRTRWQNSNCFDVSVDTDWRRVATHGATGSFVHFPFSFLKLWTVHWLLGPGETWRTVVEKTLLASVAWGAVETGIAMSCNVAINSGAGSVVAQLRKRYCRKVRMSILPKFAAHFAAFALFSGDLWFQLLTVRGISLLWEVFYFTFMEYSSGHELMRVIALQWRARCRPRYRARNPLSAGTEPLPSGRRGVAKARMSEQERTEFRYAFSLFDANGDGTIDVRDLRGIMASLGIDMTQAELREMVRELDVDDKGSIDFDDFISLSPHSSPRQSPRNSPRAGPRSPLRSPGCDSPPLMELPALELPAATGGAHAGGADRAGAQHAEEMRWEEERSCLYDWVTAPILDILWPFTFCCELRSAHAREAGAEVSAPILM